MKTLKVSKTSNPKALACLIPYIMEEEGSSELLAIGPMAANQAIKAIAIVNARNNIAGKENILIVPTFTTVDIENRPVSAIRIKIES